MIGRTLIAALLQQSLLKFNKLKIIVFRSVKCLNKLKNTYLVTLFIPMALQENDKTLFELKT